MIAFLLRKLYKQVCEKILKFSPFGKGGWGDLEFKAFLETCLGEYYITKPALYQYLFVIRNTPGRASLKPCPICVHPRHGVCANLRAIVP